MNCIAFPAGAFLLTVFLHVALGRLGWIANLVLRYVVTALFGAAILAGLICVLMPCKVDILASFALYLLLAELYVFLFSLVISSVSVSLLLGNKISAIKISKQATQKSKEMVQKRILSLLKAGFIRENSGNYKITRNGKLLLLFFHKLKILFNQKKVENTTSDQLK